MNIDNVRKHVTQYEVARIRGWIAGIEAVLYRCECTDKFPYSVGDVTESMTEDELDTIRNELRSFESMLNAKNPHASMIISLIRDGYTTAYMER